MKTIIPEQADPRTIEALTKAEEAAFHLNNLQLAVFFKLAPPPSSGSGFQDRLAA